MFDDLPAETIEHIGLYVDHRAMSAFRRLNQLCYYVSSTDSFIRARYHTLYGSTPPVDYRLATRNIERKLLHPADESHVLRHVLRHSLDKLLPSITMPRTKNVVHYIRKFGGVLNVQMWQLLNAMGIIQQLKELGATMRIIPMATCQHILTLPVTDDIKITARQHLHIWHDKVEIEMPVYACLLACQAQSPRLMAMYPAAYPDLAQMYWTQTGRLADSTQAHIIQALGEYYYYCKAPHVQAMLATQLTDKACLEVVTYYAREHNWYKHTTMLDTLCPLIIHRLQYKDIQQILDNSPHQYALRVARLIELNEFNRYYPGLCSAPRPHMCAWKLYMWHMVRKKQHFEYQTLPACVRAHNIQIVRDGLFIVATHAREVYIESTDIMVVNMEHARASILAPNTTYNIMFTPKTEIWVATTY